MYCKSTYYIHIKYFNFNYSLIRYLISYLENDNYIYDY